MREAVIVSTARTPIGKAFRGAFNNTHGATMGGHAIEHAVSRARVDPGEVEDVIMGCGLPEGATGKNIARLCAVRAGLPVSAAATTVNRFCSSGLQAIAIAANRVVLDGVPVAVAGGLESISLVQNNLNQHRADEAWLNEHKPDLFMSMLETAEVVAERYGVSREAQDEYALVSQQRCGEAQAEGRLDDEIVPLTTVKEVIERETGESDIAITVNLDGTGVTDIKTPNGFMNHMLDALARHGSIDLSVRASGDTESGPHHIAEDTAIVLGRCIDKALGERRGIVRMGHAFVPLDEALSVAKQIAEALEAARTGHSDDQEKGQSWIRSDARYSRRAPRRRRWPQRRASLRSRLGKEELPCPSTKKALFASTTKRPVPAFRCCSLPAED